MLFETTTKPNYEAFRTKDTFYLPGNLIKTISNKEIFQSIVNNPEEYRKTEIRVGYGISQSYPSPRVLA